MSSHFTLIAVASLALCGCMGPAPRTPENWTVEFWRAGGGGGEKAAARAGAVRIAQVSVRQPYDGVRLAVMRPDGSLAFDPFNAFAAAPSQMLRGAVQDAVDASGAFERALAANTSAACPLTLETTVARIALDCRKDGRRDASIELSMLLLKGREPVASARAEGKAATGDGDYSAAFSKALAKAVQSALDGMDLAKALPAARAE